jgi:hypothetical protein
VNLHDLDGLYAAGTLGRNAYYACLHEIIEQMERKRC